MCIKNIILVLLTLPSLFSCNNPDKELNRIVAGMTLQEKICQMLVLRPEALSANAVTQVDSAFLAEYEKYPVGGFCLFARNITDSAQLVAFNSSLHSLSGNPLIMVDEEGGRVARLGRNPEFCLNQYESMNAVAKSGNPSDVYDAGKYIGSYLKLFGFDIDLAPVADVNTNPENIVIGNRAFSNDPAVASQMVVAFLQGLWDSGMEGCLKHFPGHGDTFGDTHTGYASSSKTWEQIDSCEMVTFKAGIEAGARMIMSAHVSLPNVTGSSIPCTMSSQILTDILRKELGYDGIIITDGMGMGAISKNYSCEEATVGTILAGADIVLLPSDYKKAYEAIYCAVKQHKISRRRIDESVKRIIALKSELYIGSK